MAIARVRMEVWPMSEAERKWEGIMAPRDRLGLEAWSSLPPGQLARWAQVGTISRVIRPTRTWSTNWALIMEIWATSRRLRFPQRGSVASTRPWKQTPPASCWRKLAPLMPPLQPPRALRTPTKKTKTAPPHSWHKLQHLERIQPSAARKPSPRTLIK